MRALIVSTNKKTNKWCHSTMEAAYVRNIAFHRAIKQSPYEAVYGIKPHREQLTHSLLLDQETEVEAPGPVTTNDSRESSQSISDELTKKRKSISENQEDYNNRMIKQTRQSSRSKSFKVDGMVSIKIDKVDKKNTHASKYADGKNYCYRKWLCQSRHSIWSNPRLHCNIQVTTLYSNWCEIKV